MDTYTAETDTQDVAFLWENSILSTLYPNQVVQNPLGTQLQATRLVDDAFIRVCDMVNDSSMIVRAKVGAKLTERRYFVAR